MTYIDLIQSVIILSFYLYFLRKQCWSILTYCYGIISLFYIEFPRSVVVFPVVSISVQLIFDGNGWQTQCTGQLSFS